MDNLRITDIDIIKNHKDNENDVDYIINMKCVVDRPIGYIDVTYKISP